MKKGHGNRGRQAEGQFSGGVPATPEMLNAASPDRHKKIPRRLSPLRDQGTLARRKDLNFSLSCQWDMRITCPHYPRPGQRRHDRTPQQEDAA
jgi:hypothetical protein